MFPISKWESISFGPTLYGFHDIIDFNSHQGAVRMLFFRLYGDASYSFRNKIAVTEKVVTLIRNVFKIGFWLNIAHVLNYDYTLSKYWKMSAGNIIKIQA